MEVGPLYSLSPPTPYPKSAVELAVAFLCASITFIRDCWRLVLNDCS